MGLAEGVFLCALSLIAPAASDKGARETLPKALLVGYVFGFALADGLVVLDQIGHLLGLEGTEMGTQLHCLNINKARQVNTLYIIKSG